MKITPLNVAVLATFFDSMNTLNNCSAFGDDGSDIVCDGTRDDAVFTLCF